MSAPRLPALLDRRERQSRLARDGGWWGVVRAELRSRFRPPRPRPAPRFVETRLETVVAQLPLPPGVHIARFEEEDWAALRELAGRRQRELFARRSAAGREAWVAWRGTVPLGVMWLTGSVDPALELHGFDLAEGAAYGYGLYVVPRERGRGIGSALTRALMARSRDRGFRSYCEVVYEDNLAAVRAAIRAIGTDAGESRDEPR
ncbi:MAG: N-acetyltransferase family protein [Gemmatimonadota bacterium]